MQKQPVANRQLMGCGYLPPPADEKLRLYVNPWDHHGRTKRADERDETGKLHLPVCVGYVRSLPEVVEATWAHAYWEKGELTQFCEGQSTPQLRDALNEYAVELGAMRAWEADNPPPKAGK